MLGMCIAVALAACSSREDTSTGPQVSRQEPAQAIGSPSSTFEIARFVEIPSRGRYVVVSVRSQIPFRIGGDKTSYGFEPSPPDYYVQGRQSESHAWELGDSVMGSFAPPADWIELDSNAEVVLPFPVSERASKWAQIRACIRTTSEGFSCTPPIERP
jgi:hypothetical protein